MAKQSQAPSATTDKKASKFAPPTPTQVANEFRADLLKIMPGYTWVIRRSNSIDRIKAEGSQSSGSNRLSTLVVVRMERDGGVVYEAKSAGFGGWAQFLHTNTDRTLASALRGLQAHYERVAANYRSHAEALQKGRVGANAGSPS